MEVANTYFDLFIVILSIVAVPLVMVIAAQWFRRK